MKQLNLGDSAELLALVSSGKTAPRLPFLPTIYEHAGALLGKTPSLVAQDANLIVEGNLLAYELYGSDLITVGVDIYNIEAEAMGAKMEYFDDCSMPSAQNGIVTDISQIGDIKMPNIKSDGRMPLIVEASKRLIEHFSEGNRLRVPVSTAIVGPFTLASIIFGYEALLMKMLLEPEEFEKIMAFTVNYGHYYGKSLIGEGISVSVNESFIAPPLLTRELFTDHVLTYEKQLIDRLLASGAKYVPLVCGGNTTDISEALAQTGTSQLMADFSTDRLKIKDLCIANNINLRASINSKTLEDGNMQKIAEEITTVINDVFGPRFLFGCGIVSYNTKPENVIAMRHMAEEIYNEKLKKENKLV